MKLFDETYTYTTQAQVRAAFWRQLPANLQKQRREGGQNAQTCTIRCAFVDFVDLLARSRAISGALANRVTL